MSLKELLMPQKTTANLSYADKINAESALGRTIFGPIPAGHQREFFEMSKNKWLWHESWLNEYNQRIETTLIYEVKPEGVFKKQLGGNSARVDGAELENFRQALHSYLNLVKTKLYC